MIEITYMQLRTQKNITGKSIEEWEIMVRRRAELYV